MDKNIQLHLQRINKFCFLLNGRKNNYSAISSYSCGYHPIEIDGFVSENPYRRTKFTFNEVSVNAYQIDCTFNGKRIVISTKTGDFFFPEHKKTAQSIFGKESNVEVVLYHTEKALKVLLNNYISEIKDVLTQCSLF